MTESVKSEPTVGELLGSLATTTASLVKQEVHLATTEMANKTTTAARAMGMVGFGGAVLHLGMLVLAAALVIGLAAYVPMWMSALGLGALVTIIGAAMLSKGLATLKHLDPMPTRTIQTLKDDAMWAKEQVR